MMLANNSEDIEIEHFICNILESNTIIFSSISVFSFKLYLQDFCFMFVEVTKVD